MKILYYGLCVLCVCFNANAEETKIENSSNVIQGTSADTIDYILTPEQTVDVEIRSTSIDYVVDADLQECVDKYSKIRKKRTNEQITLYQLFFDFENIKSRISQTTAYRLDSNIDDELFANGTMHCKLLKTKGLLDNQDYDNNKRRKRIIQ